MGKEENLRRKVFKEEDLIKREDPVMNFIALLITIPICLIRIFFGKIYNKKRR